MKFRVDQYLSLVVLSVFFLVTVKAVAPAQTQTIKHLKLKAMAPVPVLTTKTRSDNFVASLSAQSVSVIDVPSATVLLAKNSDQKVSPASTTKLMTALVARDIFDLDQVLTVRSQPTNVGHTIGFQAGEEFLFPDLLKALLVNSGNDAAEVLAQNHPQGREGFMADMNRQADSIKLQATFFINPSGLDAAAHYTTAFDLSLIAREVMKDDVLKQIVATQQARIQDRILGKEYYFYNTNLLLDTEPGVVGIKTGTTDLAGEALVTQLERDGRQLIIVVMGSQDRYADTKKIINWIFSHYQWELI